MNRRQQHTHKLIWLILGPVLLALIAVSLAEAPGSPAANPSGVHE